MAINITACGSEEVESSFYRGRLALKDDYGIMDASESMYVYLQENSSLPFPTLIHPDDVECVKEAMERLSQKPQSVVFRMQDSSGGYHYMFGVFRKHQRVQPGLPAIDIELMDIANMQQKFEDTYDRMYKYRKLMSMSDKLYFEYYYADGLISIYEYVNGRSNELYRNRLGQLKRQVREQTAFSFKQKAEFDTLCEYLTGRAETLDLEVDSQLFGFNRGYLHLNGVTIYRNNQREMMAATVTLTGEKQREGKYYQSAYARDSATGLYNKRAIAELAMEAIAGSQQNPVFLCILDVDDFKNINDTYGHMAGDDIIAKVAEILSSVVGNRGAVGRFGGDEFLIVTDRVKTPEEFILMLKTIRKNAASQCAELYPGATVTTSVGIAQYPKDADSYEELFQLADKCLYLAKVKGKNRFIIYVPEKHKDIQMTNLSRKSKEGGQPYYNAQCQRVVELFCRLQDDTMEGFDSAMRQFIQSYDLDRIAIYGGEERVLLHSVGGDGIPMDNIAFIDEDWMRERFDDNGVYGKNQILPVREKTPALYRQLAAQGTEGYLLVKVTRSDGYPMVIVYDIQRRQRKWSESERGLLLITAQLIAEQYRKIKELSPK